MTESEAFNRTRFIQAALAWGLVVLAGALYVPGDRPTNAAFAGTIWLVISVGFFGTAAISSSMILLRIETDLAVRNRLVRRAFLSLGIKLACFALLGVVVWAGREKAMSSILIALTTLVVVPIGGLAFSGKQSKTSTSTGK